MERTISFQQWSNQTAMILGYPVLVAVAALVALGTGAGVQAGSCTLFGKLCTKVAEASNLAGELERLDREGYVLDVPAKKKK